MAQANVPTSFRSLEICSLDSLDFVNELETRLKCPVCRNVLNKPTQLSCGHHVCERCLLQVFGDKETAVCPINDDECCQAVLKKEAFPDANVSREVANLKVYCVNKQHGCKVTEPLRKIKLHITSCEYQLKSCIHEGCSEKIIKEKYPSHIESCRFKPITCRLCNQEVPEIQLKEHDNNVCLEKEINCPHGCGTENMKRRNLPQHFEICPRKPDECPFKFFDCEFTGSLPAIDQHMKDKTDDHLKLIAVYISSTHRQPTVTQQSVTNIPDDIKTKIASSESGIRDLKLKMVGLTEKLITTERKVNELPRKEVLEHQSRDITDIKERVATLTTQFSNMEGGATIARYGTLNEMADTFTSQLATHDRQIGTHDVRIAEMDLRYQILETASYNGVIIWKIKDYMRRKQDAVNGRTLSLYSQPFYTSKYGYKMCVRTYLNGDGMGRNTHVSLFFVVMGGEFDALLPWPFQQKVTLNILDQSPSVRHLSDHFHPDPNSSSFRRPTSEMNVASGCPLFVSHNVLESSSSNYIKDDTLFIRCNVDTTTGLSNF